MARRRNAERTILARGLNKTKEMIADEVYARLGYPVAVMPITGRKDVAPISRAHVFDFDLGFPRPRSTIDLRSFCPYHADFGRGVLYLTHLPADQDARRPFFYMAQREFSDQVAAISFDRLDTVRSVGFEAGAAPIMIFSIGRCGSTLLSNLMAEREIASFSEPDIFSQVDGLNGDIGRSIGQDAHQIRLTRDRIVGLTVEALYARSGKHRICVKMRSSAARGYGAILEACPNAKSVFLFRGVEGWARSWITAFGADTPKMIATLTACVAALDHAVAAEIPHRVLWYEDILSDPVAACDQVLGAGEAGDLGRVMAQDSQDNSDLSARSLETRRKDQAAEIQTRLDEFLAAWRHERPDALIRRHGLDGLLA